MTRFEIRPPYKLIRLVRVQPRLRRARKVLIGPLRPVLPARLPPNR